MGNIIGTLGDDTIPGTTGDDIIVADKGDDYVSAGDGNDQVLGGKGDDVIFGGAGKDILFGEQGDDYLSGGGGKDSLDGGKGNDVLLGGAGADSFYFNDAISRDVVMDFSKVQGDKLVIDQIPGVFSQSDLTFTTAGGNVIITATSAPDFSITLLNATLSDVQSMLTVACLLRGTLVQTPAGEVAVETLSIGDLVTTVDGTAKPVKWIGTRAYGGDFVKGNDRVIPVLVQAGALGRNQPVRDLLVSPQHALLVDGILIPAVKLVNGTTIRRAEMTLVEYFHVEFEAPEVIFTNGTPTESFVDDGTRRMFANHQEFVDLYGEVPAAARALRRFPLVEDGAEVEAVAARLAGLRAAVA